VPGLHECEALSKGFQLGAQEVMGIKFLELQVELFYKIRAMVSVQDEFRFYYFKISAFTAICTH
jgi:hypothetical protein